MANSEGLNEILIMLFSRTRLIGQINVGLDGIGSTISPLGEIIAIDILSGFLSTT